MSATRSSRPIINDTSRCRVTLAIGSSAAAIFAVAQHRHAVAEREHFLELVTDEDDGDALRPSRRSTANSAAAS